MTNLNQSNQPKISQTPKIKKPFNVILTTLGLLTLLNAQPVYAEVSRTKAPDSDTICFDCHIDAEKEPEEEFTRESVSKELEFNKNLNQIIGFINKYGKTKDELKQEKLKIVSSYIPMMNEDIAMVSDSGISLKICDLDLPCIVKYIDLISMNPAEQKEILDAIKYYKEASSIENDNLQELLTKEQNIAKIIDKFNLATEKMSLFSGQNGYYITYDISRFLPINIIKTHEGEKRAVISINGSLIDIGYLKEGTITGSIAADGQKSAAVIFQNVHELTKKPQK